MIPLSGVNFMCYHLPGCLIRNISPVSASLGVPMFDICDLSEGFFQLKIFRCFGEEELGCWEIGCRRTHWVWLVFSNLVLDQVVEHTELG